MDASIFDLSLNTLFEPVVVGAEEQPFLQVDNFMSGATVLKDAAIANDAFAGSDSYYPGVRMAIPSVYTVAVIKNLRNYISAFFLSDVKKVKKATSRYSIVTRLPTELSFFQRIPHIDAPTKKSLAMIHYLCDAQDSGTALYRHRELEYEYIDKDRCERYRQYLKKQFSDSDRYPQGYICGDTPEFEQIHSVQAKFNRAIIYRGSSLHSGVIAPSYNFDPSPATGRLTITTFVEFE